MESLGVDHRIAGSATFGFPVRILRDRFLRLAVDRGARTAYKSTRPGAVGISLRRLAPAHPRGRLSTVGWIGSVESSEFRTAAAQNEGDPSSKETGHEGSARRRR